MCSPMNGRPSRSSILGSALLALFLQFAPPARAVDASPDRDEQLISDLRHGDEVRRIRAARIIPERADDGVKRAIPFLLENLQDSNPRVAASAFESLSQIGAKALPELIRAIAEPWDVRYKSISLIGNMGPAAASAVPDLIKAMDSSVLALGIPLFPWQGRTLIWEPIKGSPAAAAGLRHGDWIVAIGSASVEGLSVEELTRRLRSMPEAEVVLSIRREENGPQTGYGSPMKFSLRREPIEDKRARLLAIEALGKIGRPSAEILPELKTIIGDNDLDKPGVGDDRAERGALRDAAMQAILSIDPPKTRDLSILGEKIRGGDYAERVIALKKMSVLAPDHRDSIMAIIEDLRVHKGFWSSSLCSEALRAIAAAHPAAMPRALSEFTEEMRCPLIGVLGDGIGSDPAWISVLVACAAKSSCDKSEAAIQQLSRLRAGGKEVQAVLLKAAAECGTVQREKAIASLGKIGPAAVGSIPGLLRVKYSAESVSAAIQQMGQEVLPALSGELKDADPVVRARAAKAMGGMGPAAIPFLAKAVRQDGDDSVQLAAAEALGQIGAPAEPILPAMSLLLEHPQPMTRILAAKAFVRVGPASVPWLAKLLSRERDPMVLRCVCEAIAELGAAAEPALAVLTKLLDHKDLSVRVTSELVMLKMGPAAKSAVPALIRAASNDYLAVRVLGGFGPAAADAIPTLQRLLSSPTEYMRLEAKSALLLIDTAGSGITPSKPDLSKAQKTMAGGGQCTISQFGLTPTARELITSGWGGVCVWNLAEAKIESPALGNGLEPSLLSSDGQSLISFSGGAPRLADVSTRRWRQLEPSPVRPILTAISADGKTLLAWGQGPADGKGGTLVRWNLDKPWVRPATGNTKERLSALCLSADGREILAGTDAGSVLSVDREKLSSSGEIQTLFATAVMRCAIDLRGRVAAIGVSNGVALLNKTGAEWKAGSSLWRAPVGAYLQSLAISPDATLVAAASSDRVLTVWTAGDSKKTLAWEASRSGLREIAFFQDGRLLGALGQEQELRLWEPSTGRLQFLLTNGPRTESHE